MASIGIRELQKISGEAIGSLPGPTAVNRARELLGARAAALITTDRVIAETRRRIEFGLNRPELNAVVDGLVGEMTVMPVAALSPLLPRAEVALRDAAASRNGSIIDAHLLALAWSVDADVWTTDRDFAGTGVATWSTPDLIRGLADATTPPPLG